MFANPFLRRMPYMVNQIREVNSLCRSSNTVQSDLATPQLGEQRMKGNESVARIPQLTTSCKKKPGLFDRTLEQAANGWHLVDLPTTTAHFLPHCSLTEGPMLYREYRWRRR